MRESMVLVGLGLRDDGYKLVFKGGKCLCIIGVLYSDVPFGIYSWRVDTSDKYEYQPKGGPVEVSVTYGYLEECGQYVQVINKEGVVMAGVETGMVAGYNNTRTEGALYVNPKCFEEYKADNTD